MATVQTGSNNGYYAIMTMTEGEQSIVDNYTLLNYSVTIYSGAYNFSGYTIGYDVNINGSQVAYQDNNGNQTSLGKYSSKLVVSGTTIVYHDSNGEKKQMPFSFRVFTDKTSYTPGELSISGTIDLTTIPRASKITAIDANIESATMININRASSSFTHTITYSFSDLSDTIVLKTSDTSVGFTIPSTFYEKIPNSKTGTVILTCTTYNGDTIVGTSSTTFTVTASEERCKPDISAILIDGNETTVALSGDNTKIIKYKSTAKITPTATAKNSATISKIIINGIEVDGDYIAFASVQSEIFTVVVNDSRGYTNSMTLQPEVIPYISLSATAKFERVSASSSEVKVKYSGNYYNGSFGNVDNELTISWAYKVKDDSEWITGGVLTPTIVNNIFSGENSLGEIFDYKTAYDFILYISDKLSTVNPQESVKKGETLFDYGVDADGNNYFWINGDLYVNGEHRKNKNLLIGNYNELGTPLNNSNLIYTNEDFLTAKYVVVFYTFQETELNYLNSVIIVPGNDWSMLCGVDNKVGYVLVGLEGILKVSEFSDDNFAVLGYSIIT